MREQNGTSLASFFNDAHWSPSANSLIHKMPHIFLLSAVLCLFSRENPVRLYQKGEREMLVYARENKCARGEKEKVRRRNRCLFSQVASRQ